MAYRRDRENPGFDDVGVELTPMADGSLPIGAVSAAQQPDAPMGTDPNDPSTGVAGRHGEAPRDRPAPSPAAAAPQSSAQAAPGRPSSPESMAGSTSSATAPIAAQLRPFTPMTQPSIGAMATPRLRGLYGSAGGLQGGGLGVPMDPVSNQTSDPIDSLIALLSSKGRA